MNALRSDVYRDQLLLTDPDLVSSVDAGMGRLAYNRIGLSELDPDLAEAIDLRDKSNSHEFRPEDDMLVYSGDRNVVYVRRYGSDGSSYWTNRWGVLVVTSTYIPDFSPDQKEASELPIPNNVMKRVIDVKRPELPGINFNVVTYPLPDSPRPMDPCDQHPWIFDKNLLTNHQLYVMRALGTDIKGKNKQDVIEVLSEILPYIADITTRYTRIKAIQLKAMREALKEFEAEVGFLI